MRVPAITQEQARKLGIKLPGSQPGKRKKPKGQEDQAAIFDAACKAWGLPVPVHEYEFHPQRKWRFDHLFQGWLALEVEGGAYTRGRHTRGKGFLGDMEKYNAAALMGYVVIRCTPKDVETGAAFALVKQALESLGEQP